MNKEIKELKEKLAAINDSEEFIEIEELEETINEIEKEINDLQYMITPGSPQSNSLKTLSQLLLKVKRDNNFYIEEDELDRMFDPDDQYFDEF